MINKYIDNLPRWRISLKWPKGIDFPFWSGYF